VIISAIISGFWTRLQTGTFLVRSSITLYLWIQSRLFLTRNMGFASG